MVQIRLPMADHRKHTIFGKAAQNLFVLKKLSDELTVVLDLFLVRFSLIFLFVPRGGLSWLHVRVVD